MTILLTGVGAASRTGSIDYIIARASVTNAGSVSRKLWDAASSTLYSDTGGLIDSVADQSAVTSAFGSSGSNRPTLATGIGPNGRTAMQFDGTDDRLQGPLLSSLITNSAGWAAVSIMPTALTANDALSFRNDVVFEDNGVFAALTVRSGGIAYAYNWDGNEDKAASASSAILVSTPYVLEWRHEGGNVYLRINGGGEVSVASGNTTTLTGPVNIGGVTGATPLRWFTGYIFEWMFASTVPSLTERDSLAGNMKNWIGA